MDDSTITNDCIIYRRVPIKPAQIIYDNNEKRWRPSSAAFNNTEGTDEMSAVLSELMEPERTLDSIVRGYENCALVSFKASLAREYNQGVVAAPLPEEPAHGNVIGQKSKKIKSAFARKSNWEIEPESWP